MLLDYTVRKKLNTKTEWKSLSPCHDQDSRPVHKLYRKRRWYSGSVWSAHAQALTPGRGRVRDFFTQFWVNILTDTDYTIFTCTCMWYFWMCNIFMGEYNYNYIYSLIQKIFVDSAQIYDWRKLRVGADLQHEVPHDHPSIWWLCPIMLNVAILRLSC